MFDKLNRLVKLCNPGNRRNPRENSHFLQFGARFPLLFGLFGPRIRRNWPIFQGFHIFAGKLLLPSARSARTVQSCRVGPDRVASPGPPFFFNSDLVGLGSLRDLVPPYDHTCDAIAVETNSTTRGWAAESQSKQYSWPAQKVQDDFHRRPFQNPLDRQGIDQHLHFVARDRARQCLGRGPVGLVIQ